MIDTFFEKNSEKFGDVRIGTTCLDNLDKQGCRHWVMYKDGKTNQFSRQDIINLLTSKKMPIPWHYRDEHDDQKKDAEKEKDNERDNEKCIIF